VSAYGDLENIRLAMNGGAFDFATKPIDMDDLALTIEKAIKQIDFVHASQKAQKKLEGLEKDLAAANQIQQFILPSVFPPFPEDSDLLDIYASMEAAKDIGGDFYDFFRIDDDHIALVIGDVCGKGIPAALFMAVSRTFIRSVGMQYEHVGECMTNVNRLLASSSVEYMFVTVFYAIYDIRTGLLTYCNCGHNPPYLLHANGTTEVLPRKKNPMVGAFAGVEYKEDNIQLEHGDTLVMYTDGVSEAMNTAGEELGIERLADILGQATDKSSQQVIETIKAGIADFTNGAEQSDDITMLVLKRE
jgi:sigma-B regulation protein RsbU (phosphoserine phosphatase)